MAMEIRDLYQPALFWAPAQNDQYGQPQVHPPVQIRVRWNTIRREWLDHQGNSVILDADAVVSQKVPIGSLMWLGTLEDWNGVGSGSGSAELGDELCEVKNYTETPDIRNRYRRRTVQLLRYHDKLPAIVS